MSFLRDYITYAAKNEAPYMFHMWAGFLALSTSVSRRVWLPWDNRAMYPNLYVLYVSDAGNGKSLAMTNLKLLITRPGIDTIMSANVETPAGLWQFMAGNPNVKPPVPSPVAFMTKGPFGEKTIDTLCHPMFIVANEFINFISIDIDNWIGHLNDISDQDLFRYRTKGGGENLIPGPYVCLLGAIPTEIAKDLQKGKIIGSGFARRTLFQWGARNFAKPMPRLNPTPEKHEAFQRCIEHLKGLKKLSGPLTIEQPALDFYDEWYCRESPTIPKKPKELISWYTTKSDHLLRLSILASLSESSDMIIRKNHMELVLDLLDNHLEPHLPKVFGGVGKNELAEVQNSIYSFISSLSEPVSFQLLRVRFFKDIPHSIGCDKGIKICLDWLLEEDRIKSYNLGVLGTPLKDSLYSTPQVMSAWIERQRIAGAQIVQQHAAQPETHLVVPNGACPPSVPIPILDRSELEATPISVQSVDETKTETPQSESNSN